jgi:hypothetical protein
VGLALRVNVTGISIAFVEGRVGVAAISVKITGVEIII